jgi:hypothetical protein
VGIPQGCPAQLCDDAVERNLGLFNFVCVSEISRNWTSISAVSSYALRNEGCDIVESERLNHLCLGIAR